VTFIPFSKADEYLIGSLQQKSDGMDAIAFYFVKVII